MNDQGILLSAHYDVSSARLIKKWRGLLHSGKVYRAPKRSGYIIKSNFRKILFKHNFLKLNIEFDLRRNSVSCLNNIRISC